MSGEVFVFLGPTLRGSEVSERLDCVVLPPVSQGDVMRLWRHRPRAIGIIDGYFERVPAVWHKEIMWMMSNGVHVFGAASMGALRAAELEAFGMRGVGQVFADFRDRQLDRDDEVTVSHADADDGYRPFSVAMVNIRASLRAAAGAGVIGADSHDTILDLAARTFYPDRIWETLLSAAATQGVEAAQLRALREWLPDHEVDQKADDARAMLTQMAKFLADDPPPMAVRWRVAETVMWAAARNRAGYEVLDDGDPRSTLLEMTLEELRLQGPDRFQEVLRRSLLTRFAVEHADREGYELSETARDEALAEFRRRRGLHEVSQLQEFLDDNELSLAELRESVTTKARVGWSTAMNEQRALAGLLDDLRFDDDYRHCAERARRKARVLADNGFRLRPSLPDDDLVEWYFTVLRQEIVPDDLASWTYDAGFADMFSFVRALRREHAFREVGV